MDKFFIYILIAIAGAVTLSLVNHSSSVRDFTINILAAISIIILDRIVENFRYIWLWIITQTWYRNQRIRLSISYLFKIKIDDKYLLVRSNRIQNQFQPVGGVFKRYRESYYALQDLKVTDDDNVPIDAESINDLRIKLPATKVISFLKWYDSQLGREVSPSREFYEELVRTEIVELKTFPYLNYIHRKRYQTKIRFSPHFKCYEILIAEIFDLMPNEDQHQALKNLQSIESPHYVWVNADSIERRGASPGAKSNITISETSEWTL